MEMMAEDGLSPARVLRTATSDAARALKLDDVGTLKPGAWGDFVVLDRDPSRTSGTRAPSQVCGSPATP